MNFKNCLYINDSDAIVTASYNCEADIVKSLISIGVSPNTQNECGETALHVTSQEGWTHFCEFLLNNGSSVEVIDNDGNTS
jgi:ankyrin repeat protein